MNITNFPSWSQPAQQKWTFTAPVAYTTVKGAPAAHTAAVGLLSESLNPGLNRVASAHPASEALQDLGLGNDLLESENPMKADKVWRDSDPSGKNESHVLTPQQPLDSYGQRRNAHPEAPLG